MLKMSIYLFTIFPEEGHFCIVLELKRAKTFGFLRQCRNIRFSYTQNYILTSMNVIKTIISESVLNHIVFTLMFNIFIGPTISNTGDCLKLKKNANSKKVKYVPFYISIRFCVWLFVFLCLLFVKTNNVLFDTYHDTRCKVSLPQNMQYSQTSFPRYFRS